MHPDAHVLFEVVGSLLLTIDYILSLGSYQICGTHAQGLEKIDRTKFMPWMLSMIAPLIAQPASKGAILNALHGHRH